MNCKHCPSPVPIASAREKALDIDPVVLIGTHLSEVVSRIGWWEAMKNPIIRDLIHSLELEITE